MKNRPKVYIVACIDVEGPANYALNTWDDVDGVMGRIASEDFRMRFPDSCGMPLKLSYFVMDWTGFKENPTGRQYGYGKIYEHYEKVIFNKMPKSDYCIGWHYHHPSPDGKWASGGWNRRWADNAEYENQINRMVLDRRFFPSVYRAGGTIEDNDQSRWLERWVPFDFSSRAPQPDVNYYLRNTKVFIKRGFKKPLWNWRRAPSDWRAYNPSVSDYQSPGSMKRVIFRCLDIDSGAYKLREKDIEKAFIKARNDGAAVCSFFTHDFYSRAPSEIMDALAMIHKVSGKFQDVECVYQTAIEAAKNVIFQNMPDRAEPGFEIKVDVKGDEVFINSNREIYSESPWVVLKDGNNMYRRIEANRVKRLCWAANFERGSAIAIGAAAADIAGNYSVDTLDLHKE